MNKLKLVYHVETGRFALQVDGYHGTGCVAKLLFGQFVVGVVGQSHVVYVFYLRQCLHAACQLQRVGGLNAIARIENFKPNCLQVGRLGGHVGAEVKEQFATQGAA